MFARWHHVSGSWLMSDKLVSLRMTRIRSKESACRIRSNCTCKFHLNTAWANNFLHFPSHHHCKITKKNPKKQWCSAWHKLLLWDLAASTVSPQRMQSSSCVTRGLDHVYSDTSQRNGALAQRLVLVQMSASCRRGLWAQPSFKKLRLLEGPFYVQRMEICSFFLI